VISERIGTLVRQRVLGLGRVLAGLGLTPNMLTVIGVVLNALVALIIGFGHPQIGGVLLLVASAFDMLDGAVARASGQTSKFGAFFDSTLDRYSEAIVFGGVLVYYLDRPDAKTGVILAFTATVGSLLISYARARAEAVGYGASVGLLARPERVILLALFLAIGHPIVALWILAVATHITALTRIVHVYRLAAKDAGAVTPKPDPAPTANRP
jgi:CDP-diacylglycerol--glycerol-3-phosphate 3-phosphatidyltransferase